MSSQAEQSGVKFNAENCIEKISPLTLSGRDDTLSYFESKIAQYFLLKIR